MTLDFLTSAHPTDRVPSAQARSLWASACRWSQVGAAALLFVAGGAVAQPEADAGTLAHFRTLHSFAFGPDRHAGGARPRTPMQASDGNLYGVTYAGGGRQFGTIYRTKPG